MSEPALHLIQRLPSGLAAARRLLQVGDRVVLMAAARDQADRHPEDLLELRSLDLHLSWLDSAQASGIAGIDAVDAATLLEWTLRMRRVHSWW